ncbi:alpha/beta fold hydrolase [Proteiniclasticum sp. C24MP]|uniref:alpha/beta hydrolase n=1 Tax=Proteiniclasticum sp. C24MP TaxID=3374101 RepID=UPI0037541BBB
MSFIVESNSLERHKFRKMINKKNIIRVIVLFLAALFFAGYLYEEYQAKIYLDQVSGNQIMVNQVNYNYEIHGSGDYIVIVDGASGESLLHKQKLMEKFDGNARLFFYDRPGYGGTEGEYKTPREIAEDLHFMFRRFGWKMEFILVGEEYGSLVMQEYLNLYPDEVLGALFINPMGEMAGSEEIVRYRDIRTASFFSKEVLGAVGLPRLMQSSGILDFFDEVSLDNEEKEFHSNLRLTRSMMNIMKAELGYMETAEALPVKTNLLGENPLHLITSNRNMERFNQERYLGYSSDVETLIVQDSVSDVMLERPQDIASSLNGLIDKITRLSYRRK